MATELKEILLQKAAEGVEIRIIYDDVGSWSLSKEFIRELRKSDIQIYPFLPVRFHHLANKANYRNHRKIAVVDGEVSTRNRHLERYPPESDRGSRDFVAGDFPDRLVFCPAGIVVG